MPLPAVHPGAALAVPAALECGWGAPAQPQATNENTEQSWVQEGPFNTPLFISSQSAKSI